jgi:hypothetical protein
MDDYANNALYGNSTYDGTLPPTIFNSAAGTFADAMALGFAGAGINALYRASNTVGVGAPSNDAMLPRGGVQVQASGNLVSLLLVGGLLWFIAK